MKILGRLAIFFTLVLCFPVVGYSQDENFFVLTGNIWKMELFEQDGVVTDKLLHVFSYDSSSSLLRSVHYTCATGQCEDPNLLGCVYQTFITNQPYGEFGTRLIRHVCTGTPDAGRCLTVVGKALNQPTLIDRDDSLTLFMTNYSINPKFYCTPKPL